MLFADCQGAGPNDLIAYANFLCLRMEEKLQRGATVHDVEPYADEAVTAFGDGCVIAELEERGVLS
jgi:hypothetical protein